MVKRPAGQAAFDFDGEGTGVGHEGTSLTPGTAVGRRGSAPVPSPNELDLGQSGWREAPLGVFLSWDRMAQLRYCAARDEDAALFAPTIEEARWFRARAAAYGGMVQ